MFKSHQECIINACFDDMVQIQIHRLIDILRHQKFNRLDIEAFHITRRIRTDVAEEKYC